MIQKMLVELNFVINFNTNKEVSLLESDLKNLDKNVIIRLYKDQAELKEINSKRKKLDNKIKNLKIKDIKSNHQEAINLIKLEVEKINGNILEEYYTSLVIEIDEEYVDSINKLSYVNKISPYVENKVISLMDKQVISSGAVSFWNSRVLMDNIPEDHLFEQHSFIGEGFNYGMIDVDLNPHTLGLKKHDFIIHPHLPSFTFDWITGATILLQHGSLTAECACSDTTYPDGIPCRGIAYGKKVIIGISVTYGSFLDNMLWSFEQVATPDVINSSVGGGSTAIEDPYSDKTKSIDIIVDKYDIVFSQAAGNSGNVTINGNTVSTLIDYSANYNGLSVSNMQDNNEIDRSKHYIHPSSSQGPIPISNRKIPDITASGWGSYLPKSDPHGNTIWTELGGTSSAAPKVAGGALLLRSAGLNGAKAIKAILINSADAWDVNAGGLPGQQVAGSHWCPVYGWGYMNLSNAYKEMYNFVEADISSSNEHMYKIDMEKNDKITLVWNKHLDQELTNLRLEMYDEDNNLENQDISEVDNVKQIDAKTSGLKTVVIYYVDERVENESYALASSKSIISLQ